MEVEAVTYNIRMSPQKVHEVTRQILGLSALHAQAVLNVVPRKSARAVAKTLASAIANAENIRTEWSEAKVQQEIADLEQKLSFSSNRKAKNKHATRLAQYRSFLQSSNRLAAGSLWVKSASVLTATSIKRFIPKARGSAGPIIKRSCHIKIVLTDTR